MTSQVTLSDPASAPGDPLFAAARAALQAPRPESGPMLYLGLFVLFLWSQFDGLKSVQGVAVLAAVILVHELGHAAGMRVFGFRDVKMFFIPFFGAAVSGRPHGAAAWKDALVSLLGPGPGIVMGLAAYLGAERVPHPLLLTAAETLLLINIFNLLPFGGLDGGRFLQRVIFSRHRVLEVVFLGAGSLLLVALGLWGGMKVLVFFAVFGLFGLPARYRLLGLASELRTGLPGLTGDAATLDDTHAHALFEVARRTVPVPLSADGNALARQMEALLDAGRPPPGLLGSIGLLLVYGALWVLAFVAGFAWFITSPPLEWRSVEEAAWVVELPSSPTRVEATHPSPLGDLPAITTYARLGGMKRFTISVADAGEPVDAAAWTRMARDRVLEETRLTLESEKPITHAGFPGTELTLSNSYRTGTVRIFVVGNRLYRLSATAPEVGEEQRRFLDSFKLRDPE